MYYNLQVNFLAGNFCQLFPHKYHTKKILDNKNIRLFTYHLSLITYMMLKNMHFMHSVADDVDNNIFNITIMFI